jgi:hypothetical protein
MKLIFERSPFWEPIITVLCLACFLLAGVEVCFQLFLLR